MSHLCFSCLHSLRTLLFCQLHLLLCLLIRLILLLDDLMEPLERVLMLQSLHLELLLKSLLLGTHLLVHHRLDILPLVVKLFLQLVNLGVLVPHGVHVAEHEQSVTNSGYFNASEDVSDFVTVHDGLVPSHLV